MDEHEHEHRPRAHDHLVEPFYSGLGHEHRPGRSARAVGIVGLVLVLAAAIAVGFLLI